MNWGAKDFDKFPIALQTWFDILGLSASEFKNTGRVIRIAWELAITSACISQILDITQAIASLTFGLLSENILIRFWSPLDMIPKNWSLSGPSIIAPNESKAEYLSFQSTDWIFEDTNAITGPRIEFPIS